MPHPTQTSQTENASATETPHPMAALGLDDFEQSLLPIARHLWQAQEGRSVDAWPRAFHTASERWGETIGLALAHHLSKLIRAVADCRDCFAHHDPLSLSERSSLTDDEEQFFWMVHHMRRDQTPEAREAVLRITQGTMDPHVIRAGLSFAARFSCGSQRAENTRANRPTFKLVKS